LRNLTLVPIDKERAKQGDGYRCKHGVFQAIRNERKRGDAKVYKPSRKGAITEGGKKKSYGTMPVPNKTQFARKREGGGRANIG